MEWTFYERKQLVCAGTLSFSLSNFFVRPRSRVVNSFVRTWKMSFFHSLVANVSSGVANLGLNRRFSLSRQDSGEGSTHDGNLKTATTPSITVTSSNLSTQHGELFFNFDASRDERKFDNFPASKSFNESICEKHFNANCLFFTFCLSLPRRKRNKRYFLIMLSACFSILLFEFCS